MERRQVQPFNCAPYVLPTMSQSSLFICSDPTHPPKKGFFLTGIKSKVLTWACETLTHAVSTAWAICSPEYPSTSLALSVPSALLCALLPHLPLPGPSKPKNTEDWGALPSHITHVHYISFSHFSFCMLFNLGSLGRKGLHRRRC